MTLGLWAALTLNAAAQTPTAEGAAPQRLDPVVVTGSSIPTTLSSVPSGVTVISREQIEARQAESVIELLRQVPGLHVDQAGARGSVSSVYVRGGDPNFTVVLIDGVKVNDPTNTRGGSFDFSTLGTDNVERIEIVRGPLSAVYGSDALSGVINVITRRGKLKPLRSLEVSGGRFGYYRALPRVSGVLGAADYTLSGSYLDNGEPVEGDEFESKALNTNFGLTAFDAVELRWVLRYADSHAEAFPDDSGGLEFAVLREADERDIDELTSGISLTHELLSWWRYSLQLGIYDREEEIFSPGVAPGVRDPFGIPASTNDNEFRRYNLTLQHRFSILEWADLAVGGEATFEDGSSRGSLLLGGSSVPTDFELERDTQAAFAEVQLSPVQGLLIQGGVRVDFPDGFDAEISPRVGVSYTVAETDTTFRSSWGEGFKLPSFFALGNPVVGNPDLVPETSRSFDVGLSQPLWGKRVTINANYFYSEFGNLVDFEEGPPPRLVNRSEVTAQGVEGSLLVQTWQNLSFSPHLTYVKTDVRGTGEELRNRPKWRGGFAVWWRPLPAVNINLNALFVGEVLDSSIPTGDRELDPYARVDVAVIWTPNEHFRLSLTVDNLFDADYEEFIGFPAPGINPRLGVQASF